MRLRLNKRANIVALGICFLLASPVMLRAQDAAEQEEPESRVLDEIVAKVNNEIITLTDLNKELRQLRVALQQEIQDSAALEEEFQRRKKVVLRAMIQTKIMVQKAEEVGATADIDLDVSAYLEQMRQDAGIPSLEVLDQFFRERGSSLAEYRDSIKEQMIQRNLLQQFVYSKITLLTPEVEAYYQENAHLFAEPGEVKLAEILFLTEGKDKAQVRAVAQQVVDRLKNGEDFEELAKEFSEGPTASRGGNIGSFTKGSMNEELEQVVFTEPVGSISDILEADYGFQIVKILERQEESLKPIDDVRPQISEALYQQKADPEIKEFLKELVDESYIFVTPKYVEEYDVTGLI